MGEQGNISQVPAAAGIVGHGINGAWDIIMLRHVAMVALVQGIEAQEVRASGRGSGGPLAGPGKGCSVIAGQPERAFGEGGRRIPGGHSKNVFVGDRPRQFEVRDGEGPGGVIASDEFGLDMAREGGAPNYWGALSREPHAAHATLARITGPDCVGIRRGNELPEASGTARQGVGESAEVSKAVKNAGA